MATSISSNETVTKLLDTNANPAPLGLMGFGLTTILLNIHNAGFFGLSSMILAMGIFYGGIAQVIAGIMEYRKNNTFGTLAFTSYGLLLADVGRSLADARYVPRCQTSRRSERNGYGLVLRCLGCLHGLHVHRYVEAQPGIAGGIRSAYDPVLPAGHPRLRRGSRTGARSPAGRAYSPVCPPSTLLARRRSTKCSDEWCSRWARSAVCLRDSSTATEKRSLGCGFRTLGPAHRHRRTESCRTRSW